VALVWRLGSVVVGCFAAAGLAVLHRSEARAPAVLARSARERPLRWALPEIILRPNTTDDEKLDGMLRASLLAGATSWNAALADCNAPKLRVLTGTHRALLPVRDGFSTVVLRTKRWCSESARDKDECYDKERAAFTTLYPNDAEGERFGDVREADMELDGVDYRWSPTGEAAKTSSLQAIVAHELGHVLGLDHPCEFRTGRTQRAPSKPACDTRSMRASIMYPLPIEEGRTPVLAPGRSERDALCTLYAQPAARQAPHVSDLQ
jgi:hypothetical protein